MLFRSAAIAGESATDEDINYVRKIYGFDRPVAIQYLDWVGKVFRGNFGKSYYFNLPVSEILASRLPVTLNGTNECLALLARVRIIEAKEGLAVRFLAHSEIQADRHDVPDV